ncbi:META domain-containing protein [Streptomyces hypolithicus]
MNTTRTRFPGPAPLAGAVTVLALLSLAACGTEQGSGAGGGGTVKPDLQLAGTDWSVDSVTVDGKKMTPPEKATLKIDDRGRASGTTGCNGFGGEVTIKGDTVTVERGATTEIGCQKDLMKFEENIQRTFSGKLQGKVTDDRLTLTTADGNTINLSAAKPAPASPLVGTQWRVESLRDGDSTTSVGKEAEGEAKLVFGKDGSVGGHLGCNNVSGTAKVSGSDITFSKIATTRKLCTPEVMDTERALLGILDGRTTYEIRERSLTLTGADGKGLEAVSVMVTQ